MASVLPKGQSTRAEYLSSTEKREEAWKFCAATIERHYDERLKRWNAELDMLLVFAGLFSAALTAFNVQSYLLLQPDSSDTVVLALTSISAQLQSFAVNATTIASMQSAFTPSSSPAPFSPPGYAVWMNALWFSSLTCTLSASSIAVVVKQWLHQYGQKLSGNSSELARLRQYRYDSLEKWRVPEIIAALPILMQTALTLFFAGLLILLYNLHKSVAISVSCLVGVLILFSVCTTVLPALYTDCCYQSPQSLALLIFLRQATKACLRVLEAIERKTKSQAIDSLSGVPTGSAIWSYIHFTVQSALRVVSTEPFFRSWQGREKPDVDARREELEQAITLTTYKMVSDKSVLNSAVVPCLSGMDALTERMSVQYGELLLSMAEKLKRAEWAAWRPVMPFVLVVLSLIVKEPRPGAVQRILSTMPEHKLTSARSHIGMLFLLSMTNLVANGIAVREAFENILACLRHTQVDQERSLTLGRMALKDVEAAFPIKWSQVEDLVNLDNFTSISHYLTGIECIVLYLLRHGPHLREHLLPVETRVETMLRGFRCFLTCPAWQESHSRQENVLWALRCSRLPELVWKLRNTEGLAANVQDQVTMSTSALQDVIEVLKCGTMASENKQAVSPGTRQAFERLESQIKQFEPAEVQLEKPVDVPDPNIGAPEKSPPSEVKPPSALQTSVEDQTEPEQGAQPLESKQDDGLRLELSASPTRVDSQRTAVETEPDDETELDIADISYILEMGLIWDEMPPTPGVDSRRLSQVAMLSPAIPEEEGDPVLPSSSARVASSRSRRASIVPAERAIPEVDAASERDRQEVRPIPSTEIGSHYAGMIALPHSHRHESTSA
ncbi:hypothetical protein C8Q70DRAFT_1056554 [Cubamyces menziesii]|nr:hypothetical protein C8Q70DRAFT_1056554 [Cubamyces menziesii]